MLLCCLGRLRLRRWRRRKGKSATGWIAVGPAAGYATSFVAMAIARGFGCRATTVALSYFSGWVVSLGFIGAGVIQAWRNRRAAGQVAERE